jgi:hypothetical protein
MSKKTRLFCAYSIDNDFRGYSNVKIYWHYANRKKPVASYPELVTDYYSIGIDLRHTVDDWIDGFFTEEEIEVLRKNPIYRLLQYRHRLAPHCG